MNFDGISGAVATSGFEQWIELESFSWGFVHPLGGTGISSSRGTTSTADVQEAVVVKRADSASALLAQAGLQSGPSATVKIAFTATVKDKVDTYMMFELSQCLISRYKIAHSGEGRPLEELALNFSKITYTFTARDAKLIGKPSSFTYDLKAGA
jgi:type VI protein secretion system component Hcp